MGMGVGTAPICVNVSMNAFVGSTRSFTPFSSATDLIGAFVYTLRAPTWKPQPSTVTPARSSSSLSNTVDTPPSIALNACA